MKEYPFPRFLVALYTVPSIESKVMVERSGGACILIHYVADNYSCRE